jgi:hypothetical protein
MGAPWEIYNVCSVSFYFPTQLFPKSPPKSAIYGLLTKLKWILFDIVTGYEAKIKII